MTSQQITRNSNLECNLVNLYGDGHKHELEQYNDLENIITKFSPHYKGKMILLGNVMVGRSSLDALLISEFGIVIIEFKSYGKGGIIKIDGQKKFHVLDNNGFPVMSSGSPLMVKGGTYAGGPLEQAIVNKNNVKDCLKKCFGDYVASKIHIHVAIVFKDTKTITGNEQLGDDYKWLSVLCMDGFYKFISYVAGNETKGLTNSQQQEFVKYISADKNCFIPVDHYERAYGAYLIGNYNVALSELSQCDPLRKDVILLKMDVLYNAESSSDFNRVVGENINSYEVAIRAKANELVGKAYAFGSNGYRKNEQLAVDHLEKAFPYYPNSPLIEDLKVRIMRRKKEDEYYENNQITKRNSEEMLSGAPFIYRWGGRIAESILFLIVVSSCLSILAPFNSIFTACILNLMGLAALWLSLRNDPYDIDRWFVRKSAPNHVYCLEFRLQKVKDYLFDERDYRIVPILCGVIFMAYKLIFATFAVICIYRLLNFSFMAKVMASIYEYSCVDVVICLPTMISLYLLVHISFYGYGIFSQISANAKDMYKGDCDSQTHYYAIVIPTILNGAWPKLDVAYHTVVEALKFGLSITALLVCLGVVKPYLYQFAQYLYAG